MSWAMFRVMALELWRDRGAFFMAFALPPLVFIIFAAVFAGATGENIQLKIAVANLASTPAAARLEKGLIADADLRAIRSPEASLASVRAEVRSGRADAGVVIAADPATARDAILIVSDPTRAVAAPLTQARVQQVLARFLPDVVLARTVAGMSAVTGPLTPQQAARLAAARSRLARDPPREVSDTLFGREAVEGAQKGGGTIAYYAGAVTILFALFSAMHGALSLIEERQSGISDRILAGPAGMGPVVRGKFLFLFAQAVVQATAIFATAQLLYGAPVVQHLSAWLVTTAAVGVCSGGLALGVVSLCRTRDQAQMLSTFVILILAAIGGSMVPRFLMPAWLQQVGWFTPHAWAIDAYQGVLWRDEGPSSLYKAWLMLAVIGLAGLAIAQAASRRARR
ncbi:MAG: ABC transporter permease [Caulobacteraceae bacterium]